MECTAPTTRPSTFTVDPASLATAFARIPDPRRRASVQYPLPAVLGLAVCAILCARTSVLAMAEWGSQQSAELLTALGFPADRTPCQSTLQRLFRRLDPAALSVACQQCFAATPARERGAEGIAIDGKAQRGRLQYEPDGSPVHALVAVCHERGVVLAQEPIRRGTDKAEAELTVAPILISRLDWQGRVLTGDALHCQRHLCAQVLAAGGDYLLVVKANQPRLLHDLERCFTSPLDLVDRRDAATLDQGHGRTAERRTLIATTDLVGYLAWPGHAQVFQLTRVWKEHGKRHVQVRYGVTSLPPEIGTAERLLALKRGHWCIENRAHRAKDVNFGEDASLVHVGAGPIIYAMLRDAALSLLRAAGITHVAAQLRRQSQHPHEALALLLNPPAHA
jgi:predicted transposase YbfD/YdcC